MSVITGVMNVYLFDRCATRMQVHWSTDS